MGLELPPALHPLLLATGHTWTDIDEAGLVATSMRLARFDDDATRTTGEADDLVTWVHNRNDSEGTRAFHDDWHDETGLAANGEEIAAAILLMMYALAAAALIVMFYKLSVIFALLQLVMRLSATMMLPGAGAAAFAAEKIAATRLRGIIGKLFARMVVRPLAKAGEYLGAPMVRRPGRWPASFDGDPLRAAVRPVDPSRLDVSNPVWRTDRRSLWRGDDRSPDEIFEHGFHPRGDTTSLEMHQHDYSNSAFVSTTASPYMGTLSARDYRYLIDAPGGIYMNPTLRRHGMRIGTPREREVSFLGGIDRRYIVGAQRIRRGDVGYHPFIPNPHYDPGS
jgi:hypothetical protein